MRQHKAAQNRFHERISAALAEKFVDPELKPAVQRELRSKNFVLAEDQKKGADGERTSVACVGRERHARMIYRLAWKLCNNKCVTRVHTMKPATQSTARQR